MDMLQSWTDGPTKSVITDFVERVTEEGGPDYVEPAARVAVFDNDGTLWTEKPLVIQLDFTIRRFREMARNDSSLQDQQPYKAAYEDDLQWLSAAMIKHYQGDDRDLELLEIAVPKAFEAVTIEDYDQRVKAFFAEADNPKLKRPYRECGYAPMVDLLRYLETNGFATYIASGGDRDFMRPVAQEMYGIPPERIIGSALGISYSVEGGQSSLVYKGAMDFFDDGPEKRSGSGAGLDADPSWPSATPTATCQCLSFPEVRQLLHSGCCYCTTMQTGNSTTWPVLSRRWRQRAARIGPW